MGSQPCATRNESTDDGLGLTGLAAGAAGSVLDDPRDSPGETPGDRDLAEMHVRAGRERAEAFARDYPALVPVFRDLRFHPDRGLAASVLNPPGAAGTAVALARFADGPRARIEVGAASEPWRGRATGCDPARVASFLGKVKGLRADGLDVQSAVALAGAVPAQWLPETEEALASFGVVAALAFAVMEASGGTYPVGGLVASSKGRWDLFRDACAQAAPPRDETSTRKWALEVAGVPVAMAASFARQVMVPAMACDERLRIPVATPDAAWIAGDILGARLARGTRLPLREGSWRTLFGDKGLLAILAMSFDWRQRSDALDRALLAATDPRTWTVPFPDWVSGDGARLVGLGSAADLAGEGRALSHCAGDFADACAGGGAIVLSVRRPGPDGRLVPTSTVELEGIPQRGPWRPRVIQHRGRANADPTRDDALAVAEWASRHGGEPTGRSGRTAAGSSRGGLPAWMPAWLRNGRAATRPFEKDALAVAAGYDWRDPDKVISAAGAWSGFLPRRARSLTFEGLVSYLGGPTPVLGLLERTVAGRPPLVGRWRAAALGAVAVTTCAAGSWLALTLPSEDAETAFGRKLGATAASHPVPCPESLSPPCGALGPFVAGAGGADVVLAKGREGRERVVMRTAPGPGGSLIAHWPLGIGWKYAIADAMRHEAP